MIITCKAIGTGLAGGASFVMASAATDEMGSWGKYLREGGALAIIAASIAFILWRLVPMVITLRQQENARFADTMERLAATHAVAIKDSRTEFHEALKEISREKIESEQRMLEGLERNSEAVRCLADKIRT